MCPADSRKTTTQILIDGTALAYYISLQRVAIPATNTWVASSEIRIGPDSISIN